MKKLLTLALGMFMAFTAAAKDYSQYANPTALVSPQKAKEIMETQKNVVVLDARKPSAFMLGHVPGAKDIWRPTMQADKGKYPFGGMRASKEKMEKVLGSYGIDKDTYILIYDAKADYDAARLWWILDMYGHEKMSLIDGGIQGWEGTGLPLERGPAKRIEMKKYKFDDETDYSKLAHLEDVKSAVKTKDAAIIDTRGEDEHLGSVTKKGAFRPGRIPSETFIPWESAVNTDKTFRGVEELREMYAKHGITANSDVIAYCQSGVRSAHTTFVLTQLLGYKDVKNYDGSWIEWSYHKELKADRN